MGLKRKRFRCGWRTLWVLAVCMVEIGRVRVKAGNAPIEQKISAYPPQADSNILEGLRSHIITGNLDLAPDLPIGIIGHADPARFGDALKAGSNVDAIAEDVVVIENDITDVNPDAEFDPLIRWHGGIMLGHTALDFNRTAHRIQGA